MNEMIPPEAKRETGFTYRHPAVGEYAISSYVVESLEGANIRDGASRQDSGWYFTKKDPEEQSTHRATEERNRRVAQCSEGNIPQRRLYKALQDLENAVARKVAWDLSTKQGVPWDFPARDVTG